VFCVKTAAMKTLRFLGRRTSKHPNKQKLNPGPDSHIHQIEVSIGRAPRSLCLSVWCGRCGRRCTHRREGGRRGCHPPAPANEGERQNLNPGQDTLVAHVLSTVYTVEKSTHAPFYSRTVHGAPVEIARLGAPLAQHSAAPRRAAPRPGVLFCDTGVCLLH
jgi:hypothetical protein